MKPEPVLTRESVRELDRQAIEDYGIPSIVLMESAGRACAEEALRMLGDATEPALVLCGPGNNGGDGLVIARTLVNRGRRARVVFVGAHDKLEAGSDDFRTNLRLWRGLGEAVEVVANEREAVDLPGAPLVVDALFGTGLTRELGPPWSSAIDAANASGAPILAVDLPSGLDANTGEVLGTAIRAATTVSFVARKPGFAIGAGPELCGRVVVAEIGIPRFLIEREASL